MVAVVFCMPIVEDRWVIKLKNISQLFQTLYQNCLNQLCKTIQKRPVIRKVLIKLHPYNIWVQFYQQFMYSPIICELDVFTMLKKKCRKMGTLIYYNNFETTTEHLDNCNSALF